jgi:hypothetical protein
LWVNCKPIEPEEEGGFHLQTGIKVDEGTRFYLWSIAFCGAET